MSELKLPYKGSLDSDTAVFAIECSSGGGTAIAGESFGTDQFGDSGIGVAGGSDFGVGVQGSSQSGAGVTGSSDSGSGVYGVSSQFDAIVGQTNSDAHAGVTGRNMTTGANGGVGLYGTGGLYAGKFDGSVLVNGTLNATNDNGWAIGAISKTQDAINSTSASPQHAGVSANNSAGGFALWASSKGTGVFAQGNPAGYFNGDVHVTGDLVLINSPSSGDVAEDFDLEDDPLHAEPGTVLIISPNGRLSASLEMYDTRVAGVISGAGELKPAVVLQRIKTGRRRSPIALIGKVFCKVDATFASIMAGDLLTTSATPGHAMKVTDRPKALGAILGKALAPLESGCGLIPILVSLR